MEQLVIIDYGTGRVIILNVDNEEISIDDIFDKFGLNEDECSYMWSNNLEVFQYHKVIKTKDDLDNLNY